MKAVTTALFLLALDGVFAALEPCTFYAFDGCRCHTDTATLDISEYFSYPVVIVDAEQNTYTYNPCVPFECGSGEPAVICQRGAEGETRALGRLDNSTTWYVESYFPLQFTLHYYNGDPGPEPSYREAVVTMLHDNSAMSAVFINEDPKLTYNFGVTGNKVVAEQEICTFDPADSCRCQTNTVSLDIREYFKYPVKIVGQGGWNYTYSPCAPIPCGDQLVAVCQNARNEYHTVGIADSSTICNIISYNPLQFTIHYFGGEENRNAVVNMSYENTAMSAKFTSEFPLRTYHFDITGNEVLAKPSPNLCTFYPSENCRCHTDKISLDISDYFQYPVKLKGQGVYDYIYSPCAPIRCGTEAATVCQVWESPEIYYVAGRLDNSTIWYVNSYNPLQFTIHYFDGDEGRNAEFTVSYENTDMSVKFRSENPLLTYHFDITGNKVVPSSAVGISPHAPDDSLAPPSSMEEEEEEKQEERSLFRSCVKAGLDKLVLLGALALLFLILLIPFTVQRRRRFYATGSGYSAIPSKEKDILC